MELIFSNFSPAKITNKSLQDTWLKLFKSADEVLIATGYISNDSIEDLHSILQQNPDFIKNIQILVGMHYLEGFTKLQYDSLIKLNNFLCVFILSNFMIKSKVFPLNPQNIFGLNI